MKVLLIKKKLWSNFEENRPSVFSIGLRTNEKHFHRFKLWENLFRWKCRLCNKSFHVGKLIGCENYHWKDEGGAISEKALTNLIYNFWFYFNWKLNLFKNKFVNFKNKLICTIFPRQSFRILFGFHQCSSPACSNFFNLSLQKLIFIINLLLFLSTVDNSSWCDCRTLILELTQIDYQRWTILRVVTANEN